MKIQSVGNEGILKMVINDSVVEITFVEEENKDLKRSIIDILTGSYNSQILTS